MIPYNFHQPTKKVKLHHDLDEVSGLSYFSENVLVAVEDETGKLYLIDTQEGKILERKKFAKAGDYEGVAFLNNNLYVIKSDGHLYSFEQDSDYPEGTTVAKLPFSINNDVEGLTAIAEPSPALLIACKAAAGINGNKIKGRAIYHYDLNTGILDQRPWLHIDKQGIETFIDSQGLEGKVKDFKPSGIAQHPLSKDIYILSHHRKQLLVVNSEKEIKAWIRLDKDMFRQPEGICFSPDGTLYISNEAQEGRANILSFEPQNP